MAIIVTDTPSDFVDYLTDPGLPVYDMNIPLKQYVCLTQFRRQRRGQGDWLCQSEVLRRRDP